MEQVGNQITSFEPLNLEDYGYSPEVKAQYDQLIAAALLIMSSDSVTPGSLIHAQRLLNEAQQLLKDNPSPIEKTLSKIEDLLNVQV